MSVSKFLMFFAFCVLSFSSFAAVEDIEQAKLVIEQSSNRIEQTLKQPDYQNDFAKATVFVDEIVSEFVDMRKVTLLVLGKNVRKATPEQLKQFMREFKTLLVRTYTRAFLQYQDWSLSFNPYNDKKDDGKTIVKTVVQQPGKQPVNISYRMQMNKKGEWKVYEISIEGVSLVINYRSAFSQQIAKTGSIDAVIQSLVEKNKGAKLN